MKFVASLPLVALLSSPAAASRARPAPADLARRLARRERRGLQRGGSGKGDGTATTAGRGGSAPAAAPAAGVAHGNLGRTHDVADDDPATYNSVENVRGLALDRGDDLVTYEYGAPVQLSIDVTADVVDRETFDGLDGTRTDEWTVGLFMRKQRPGPTVDPIATAVLDALSQGAAVAGRPAVGGGGDKGGRGGRGLQRGGDKADDTEVTTSGRGASGGGRGGGGKDDAADADAGTGREDAPAEDEEDPYADEYNGDFQHDDGTDVGDAGAMGATGPGQQDFLAVVTPPALPVTGHAHFDAGDTRLSKLDHKAYGTGFDVYLLDREGNAVAGPAYLAMIPGGGTDGADAQALGLFTASAGASGRGKGGDDAPSTSGLLGYHAKLMASKRHHDTAAGGVGVMGVAGAGSFAAGTLGQGTGAGAAPILATPGALGTYVLESDKGTYAAGDTVTITYDVGMDDGGTPGKGAAGRGANQRRRRAKASNQKRTGGRGGRGGRKNGGDKGRDEANAGEGAEAEPATLVAVGRSAEVEPAPGADATGRGDKAPADEPEDGVVSTAGGRGGGGKGDVATGGDAGTGRGASGRGAEGAETGGLRGGDADAGDAEDAPPLYGDTSSTVAPVPDEDEDPLDVTTTPATIDMAASEDLVPPGTQEADDDDACEGPEQRLCVVPRMARALGHADACLVDLELAATSGTAEFPASALEAFPWDAFSVYLLDCAYGQLTDPVTIARTTDGP